MLVRERGWSAEKYQDWVADALVQSLLTQGSANPGSRERNLVHWRGRFRFEVEHSSVQATSR